MTARPWAECHETHLSAVFSAGDRVLKLKKPVRTAFVDLTTRDARDRACQEEMRLNLRLSPDVYLGVAHIGLHDGGAGEPVVVMRRLDDADRLDSRIEQADGAVSHDEVREVARRLAVFHGSADIVDDFASPGSWPGVHEAWVRETSEVLELLDPQTANTVRLIRELALTYVAGRRPLFEERVRSHQVREGHGDLRCEHVYFTDRGVRVLDCVEFDKKLRVADVVSDVAFLAMDLERLGAGPLAAEMLAAYREYNGSSLPSSLLHLYISYRALVRAKVLLLRADQLSEPDPTVAGYFRLAVEHLRSATPVLICIGGLPGSGKTTLSTALADAHDGVHLSTDEIRHDVAPAGTDRVDTPWESGAYAPAVTQHVYEELLHRAQAVLSEGSSVVLDATWRDPAWRQRAIDLGSASGAIVVEIACETDEPTARRRLGDTSRGFSQAGVETRVRMRTTSAPWPSATVIDTTRAVTAAVEDARQAVVAATDRFIGGVEDSVGVPLSGKR